MNSNQPSRNDISGNEISGNESGNEKIRNGSNSGPPFIGRVRTTTKVLLAIAAVAIIGIGISTITFGETTESTEGSITPASLLSSDKDSIRILPVDTLVAREVSEYTRARWYIGTVKAGRTSELSFKRPDLLREVLVDQGSRVTRGQVLAQLDTRRLISRRDQWKAQLAVAEAMLAELVAGPRVEVIDAQKATVAEMEAEVRLTETQLARRTRLVRNNAVSQDEFDITLYGLAARKARLQAAQSSLAELNAGTRKEKLAAQSAEVNRLQAMLAEIEIEIDESTLHAPYDGAVTKRYLDEGAIISPSEPVIRLVEINRLEAWVGVPQVASHSVGIGSSHSIVVAGQKMRAKLKAKVAEIDPTTQTSTFIFDLEANENAEIIHEQICRVQLDEIVESNGFWVPTTALAPGIRGLWAVLVARREDSLPERREHGLESVPDHAMERNNVLSVARRDVDVIYTDGDRSLIRGTIVDGDIIVASGIHRLVPGQRVTPHPMENQKDRT